MVERRIDSILETSSKSTFIDWRVKKEENGAL